MTAGPIPLRHGVDLVAIEEFRAVMARHASFEERVFTAGERAYCLAQADPAVHFAARFAAKEAVLKALGAGIGAVGIDRALGEVEVVREAGSPRVVLAGRPARIARRLGCRGLALSLSHTREHALASVVAWGAPGEQGGA
jgi:holo-[acyl-carrier protein] synthase